MVLADTVDVMLPSVFDAVPLAANHCQPTNVLPLEPVSPVIGSAAAVKPSASKDIALLTVPSALIRLE